MAGALGTLSVPRSKSGCPSMQGVWPAAYNLNMLVLVMFAFSSRSYRHIHVFHPCRYKVIRQLGDGTYGSVWKAINRETNAVVQILFPGAPTYFLSWHCCITTGNLPPFSIFEVSGFLGEVRSI